MTVAWDEHDEQSLQSLQDALVREQVRELIAPFSPLWRFRLAELGIDGSTISSAADLEAIPAMGERDVSLTGDAAGMSALLVQVTEPIAPPAPIATQTRKGRLRRPRLPEVVTGAALDIDNRATSYVFTGLGFSFPIASTRRDLDLVARAGMWLWDVLGLTRDDVLVSGVAVAATTEHTALAAAALCAGSPALFPGERVVDVAAAIRLAPPTVLALSAATAADTIAEIGDVSNVRTVLLVGAPSEAERRATKISLFGAGGDPDAVVLGVHVPSGGRVCGVSAVSQRAQRACMPTPTSTSFR